MQSEEEIQNEDQYRMLREKYYASEGVRKYNAFLSNRTTHYTFEANYRELKDRIEAHFELRLTGKLGDWNNKEPLHNFLTELSRLLHNYLASAKSLVDQTRHFVQHTFGPDSQAFLEYQQEIIARFGASPINKFTMELRNLFTHVSTPFISSVIGGSAAKGRDVVTVKLRTTKISPSWTWSSLARQYITSQDQEIDLELYVIEHRGIITDFYNWLGPKIQSWADTDWREMDLLLAKLARYERRESLDQ